MKQYIKDMPVEEIISKLKAGEEMHYAETWNEEGKISGGSECVYDIVGEWTDE